LAAAALAVVWSCPQAKGGAPPSRPATTPSVSSAPAKLVRPALPPARRDPVLPPLVEQAAWREWLLSVRLNGQAVSLGGLFVESPDGTLAAQLALLDAWRVRVDGARVITFQGAPYYPLQAIAGATYRLDRDALALALEIPPDQFTPFVAEPGGIERLRPVAGTGGFLDYDLIYQAGDDLDQGISGLAELGGFHAGNTLLSGLLLQDLTTDPEVIRLDSALSRDMPDRRITARLGDSIAPGGAFSPPVRFGGLQYATNFATDPAFVTFPLPTIGGLARQDSVVDVFIDNVQREARSVPPGPFAIESLPAVTGAGEVQLRVTDLLGREQLITQSYYVSSRLLKSGLHDFAYQAGAVRRGYGNSSFDYGEALASATHRFGFSDRLTGEAHGEIQPDQQSGVLGASYLLGRWGVVSSGLGLGRSDGGPGILGQLAYEYDGRSFSFGARTRYTSDGYREAGGDEETARVDQLSLGLDFGERGRFGALFVHTDGRDTENATTLAASYSVTLGPGALTLRAAQLFEPDRDLALTALYTIPLGSRRSATAEVLKRDGDYAARSVFRQTRGASDLGADYRIAAEAGTRDSSLQAAVGYQTAFGGGDLAVERFDGSNALRAGVNGSIALIDGEVAFSRRIDRAFGLVDLPGFPDVRVYLDNREAGRTDAEGRLLLPGLRPYEGNKVRLEVDDLPLDADITTAEVEAVPYDRSGMTIDFPLARRHQATALLQAADGSPLPIGLRLRSADGTVTAWVARDGFTQVNGALPAAIPVMGGDDSASVTCELPAAEGEELLPDLGTIRCR
jgi:outer membrane usher protein